MLRFNASHGIINACEQQITIQACNYCSFRKTKGHKNYFELNEREVVIEKVNLQTCSVRLKAVCKVVSGYKYRQGTY